MNASRQFAIALAIPASGNILANAMFSVVTGEIGYLLWTLFYDGTVLVLINILLARRFLFRPVQALMAGQDSTVARRALEQLPTRAAIWSFGFYLLFLPVGFYLSTLAGSYGGDFGLPLDYIYFVGFILALVAGYLVYFFINSLVTRIKLHLFAERNLILPGGGGRLRRRMVVAISVIAIMPVVLLAAEFFWFTRYRDGGGLDLSFEGAIIMDILVSFFLITLVIIYLPRSMIRPIEILARAVERVAKGDLTVRAPVTSNDEIGGLTTRFNDMVDGLNERQAIRETFGKYVPEAVAEQLIRDPGVLAGEERIATIMFTDIEGFTGFSEMLTPAETIGLLNEYFELVLEPIRAEGGTVNAFIGDSIFASFNVPVPHDDHAARAIRAALAIQKVLDGKRFGPGQDIRLVTRIGINTGTVAAGAVGSGDRLGYTIIGDTVNVASRLEGLAKELGGPILVSDTTRRTSGESFVFEPLGKVAVRGRAREISVWRVSD
ncbi:MAG: adenylate/guanylate cyclase domain-containing protein [Minwuia sp.]|nr:adenylate/guanylate cyclase domain-containing protein [Minwuia sp.]